MPPLIVVALVSLMLTQPGADSRPRDPWVIRGVLDQQPRMITIALDDDLWVAYDTKTCSFYRAWIGDVDYTGAVYDTLHGPQPKVRGEVWLEQPIGSSNWNLLWQELSGHSNLRALQPQWKGYRFVDGQVEFMYEVEDARGNTIQITETPEVSRLNGADGAVAFDRTFTLNDLPSGTTLLLAIPFESSLGPLATKSNGRLLNTKNSRQLQLSGGPPVELKTYLKPAQTKPAPDQEQENDKVPFFLAP